MTQRNAVFQTAQSSKVSTQVVGKGLKSLGDKMSLPDAEGTAHPKRDDTSWSCRDCPLRKLNVCSSIVDAPARKPHVGISRNQIKPRQTICRKDQTADQIYVIKEGWAFRYAITASGRRQILSFLMPGDLMISRSLYDDRVTFPVQSVTDVSYCGFNRDELIELIGDSQTAARALTEACADERMLYEERLIDLGTRSAEERVVRFLLEIMGRQDKRGYVHNQMLKFPLKQIHLADALGLTQVHVNRVLKRLREGGLIEWSRGVLKIEDLPAMKQIADIR